MSIENRLRKIENRLKNLDLKEELEEATITEVRGRTRKGELVLGKTRNMPKLRR